MLNVPRYSIHKIFVKQNDNDEESNPDS